MRYAHGNKRSDKGAANAAARQLLARDAPKTTQPYNVSQPHSSTSKAFARYPLVLGGTVPSLQWEGVYASRRFSAHRCLLHTCWRGQCTGVGTTQSQAAPSPSTIDIIKQPPLLRQKLAGNCTTTCQWSGLSSSATSIASNVEPSLGKPWEGIVFATARARLWWGGDVAARQLIR
jgi:hypothetical protein